MTENTHKNLSERLKFALKSANISQTELAKRIGVKPQVIQYLCASKSEKSKFTFDIAEALNIDAMWLAHGNGATPVNNKLISNERIIPVLSFNQIKLWKVYGKEIDFKRITNWIPIKEDININSFAVILTDISMSPRFNLDTLIIIDPTIDTYKNQVGHNFVLAYIQEEDFLVFRQLEIADNSKKLVPLNNCLYKKILLKDNDIILGSCVEARWNG